ncbi:hypothetical protein [Aeromonas caviae]|uniref:hypothetical protein n=1 Tax=Aeromonas caviae TaxID=648 RepID=UPI002B466298|nr:hypothetical protein [Aeromonas caviae]
MRKITTVIALLIAFAIIVLPLVLYFINFGLNPDLSFNFTLAKSLDDWSAFGGFFGGTVGPVISAFAFIGVWLTYRAQREQIRFAESRATIDELQRLLATATDAFENFMNQPIGISLEGKNFTRNDALEHAYTLKIIPALPIPDPMFTYLNDMKHYLFLDLANRHLDEIAWCMTEFQNAGGSEKITEYYKIKLNIAITIQRSIGSIPDDALILRFFPDIHPLK